MGTGTFFFSQCGMRFLESSVGNFFAEDDLFGTIPATLEMPLWSSIRQVTKANLGRQAGEGKVIKEYFISDTNGRAAICLLGNGARWKSALHPLKDGFPKLTVVH